MSGAPVTKITPKECKLGKRKKEGIVDPVEYDTHLEMFSN